VFDLVVDKDCQAATTVAVQQRDALLAQVVARVDQIEAASSRTAATSTSTSSSSIALRTSRDAR